MSYEIAGYDNQELFAFSKILCLNALHNLLQYISWPSMTFRICAASSCSDHADWSHINIQTDQGHGTRHFLETAQNHEKHCKNSHQVTKTGHLNELLICKWILISPSQASAEKFWRSCNFNRNCAKGSSDEPPFWPIAVRVTCRAILSWQEEIRINKSRRMQRENWLSKSSKHVKSIK